MQKIITPRLALSLMTEDFLEAGLNADREKGESLIGLKVPQDWLDEREIMSIRLADYREDSAYLNWGLRAVGLRETNEMIGFMGFHTRPNPEYLQHFAPAAIEFGYVIFSKYRRRGFACEAIISLMNWAAEQHPLQYFIAAVSPLNIASTTLVKKLGFEQIGEQIDEIEGLELVYALAVNKLPPVLSGGENDYSNRL